MDTPYISTKVQCPLAWARYLGWSACPHDTTFLCNSASSLNGISGLLAIRAVPSSLTKFLNTWGHVLTSEQWIAGLFYK